MIIRTSLKSFSSFVRSHFQPLLWCMFSLFTLSLSASEKPNILIILADDMGYGDLTCYNPEGKIRTPHLDALAANGMRFTDAHSGGSSCIPSRYALMTGRFAVHESMRLNDGALIKNGRETIASLLKEQGYSTAMVGKWHLGFDPYLQNAKKPADYSKELLGGPVDCGFDTFFGMHASLDLPPYFYIRGRKATMPPSEDIAANNSMNTADKWTNIQGAFWRKGKIAPDFKMEDVTQRLADEAVQVIQNHTQEKPLFLYLSLPSPHTPWLPPKDFVGKSGAGMYGDFVLQVDDVVGQVSKALNHKQMQDNTLIIFSSDNGPVWYDKDCERFAHKATGELRGMKFSSHEGGHRMPFIASWPKETPKASTCEQTIVFSDLFATFAELNKGKHKSAKNNGEDSVSFLAFLKGDKNLEKRPAIIHDRWTIRDGKWKLILKHKKGRSNYPEIALYDLSNDLSEQNNIASKHPAIVEKFSLFLNEALKDSKQ